LLDGKLTFESAHDYKRLQDPQVQEIKQRVELVADAELERTGARFQGLVEVTLKDGRTLREHVSNCRGRPENPMSPEEVEKKAAWLMEPVLGKRSSDQVVESMRRIETLPSIRDLAKTMMLA
jgi:2-methylcitrate dehydratase PrpD